MHGAAEGREAAPRDTQRRTTRRRRLLLVGGAGLCVLLAMAVTAQATNSGTTSATVESASPSVVYPVGPGGSLPSAVNALEFTPASGIDQSAHVVTAAVTPSWGPSAGSAGSVTGAGDLAIIDEASTTYGATVNMFIVNLAGMQEDYSSFLLPIKIYASPCTGGACTWTAVPSSITNAPTYITSASGFITFHVASGMFYDVTISTGGSYYCTATSTGASATLSPTFYFTAQATPL